MSQDREARLKPGSLSAVVSTIGALLTLAGAFEIPWNYALFLGIACFVITGEIPAIMGKGEKAKVGKDKEKPDERIMGRRPASESGDQGGDAAEYPRCPEQCRWHKRFLNGRS